MAKKDLSDDEILRLARIRVTESAASTFSEGEIQTQLSIERGVIWLIRWVSFFFNDIDKLTKEVGANAFESITAQITRESKTALINDSDSDMLQSFQFMVARQAAIGTDAGPLWNISQNPYVYHFPLPMPLASQSVFVGIKGSDASAKHVVDVRIGYTIKEVSNKFFFRVAQALVG